MNLGIFSRKHIVPCPFCYQIHPLRDRFYTHDGILKCIAVDGSILQFVAICIDCVDRIVQHLRYARALLNAKSHERDDAEVGIELFAFTQDNLLLRTEKLVDLRHECRIDM